MTREKAVRLAVESMERERKSIAWDANFYERYGGPADGYAAKCHQRRDHLAQAIQMLEGMRGGE
jgi:hypothetical protein